MNEVWTALIASLASNPALLLLALILAGGGWLGYKLLRSSQIHSRKREDELLNKLLEHTGSMAASMKEVKDEIKELRIEMTEVINDLKEEVRAVSQTVAVHEVRINQIEHQI